MEEEIVLRRQYEPYVKKVKGVLQASPEEFRKYVEESERKYGISDCIYRQCIEELSGVNLSQLNEDHEIRIIRPFLLTWGVMGRVLGYEGVSAIREKLEGLDEKITPLRRENLFSVKLHEIKELVIELFDEIRQTEFKSKKGKQKEVGSTAASKVLHLTCPNLFIMWDSAIRAKYSKTRGNGEDYFEFLVEMKEILQSFKPAIEQLQKRYGTKVTRIIDQYNWMATH